MNYDILNTRRRELLLYIKDRCETGPAPSQQEMASALNVSTATIHKDLETLAAAGWIEKPEGKTRSVQVIELPEEE